MGGTAPNMDVFNDILNMTTGIIKQSIAQNSAAEEVERTAEAEADLMEEQSVAKASKEMGRARKEISQTRKDLARQRSARRANWGGAGLTRSGSVLLQETADAVQDHLTEDGMRFGAQSNVDSILSEGRAAANAKRKSAGVARKKSTLSLGSKIYGPKR